MGSHKGRGRRARILRADKDLSVSCFRSRVPARLPSTKAGLFIPRHEPNFRRSFGKRYTHVDRGSLYYERGEKEREGGRKK